MWAQYGSEFLGLALVHFLAVLLPGPDFAVTVRHSVRYGYLIGCLTALGIGVGISIHVLYTLVGLGIIIQQSSFSRTRRFFSFAANDGENAFRQTAAIPWH